MTALEICLVGLAAAALALAFDFQRRWFAGRAAQRDHEQTLVLELVAEVRPLLEGQIARDARNDKALTAFLTEMRDGVASITRHAQKTSTDTVAKLQAMSRAGVRGR